MKKLLLLLFLIPNLVMGGFDADAARADGVSEEDIQAILASEQAEEIDCSNLTKKEQKEFKKQCDGYYKVKRMQCAAASSDAKTDFAAKKIYETCLDRMGVPKK